MQDFFVPAVLPPSEPTGPCRWFCFAGYRLLLKAGVGSLEIPSIRGPSELGLQAVRKQYLGMLEGEHCFSAELEEESQAPDGMLFLGLRSVYGQLDDEILRVAFFAIQIMNWDRSSQFCGRCGTGSEARRDIRAKECPRCGFIAFPKISPAIIVLVERGKQILLARSKLFAPGLYSVIAGFVELGETLEEAVFREVKEETGIEVSNIEYFGSQPWPFPDSLMIAFTAKYKSGEITLDDAEIEDARWFEADGMPSIPSKMSISRSLIDFYLGKHK